MARRTYTIEQIRVMTTPELRRAVKAAGITPRGGVSTAPRQQCIDWLQVNGLISSPNGDRS